jgi:hypothetical protein
MQERPDLPQATAARRFPRARPGTRTGRKLLVALLLLLAVAMAAATAARAEIVTARDDQGRTITFDVLTPGVDVEWYASLLRPAGHGNEISSVTIRIVAPDRLGINCGPLAEACYGAPGGNPTIIVPAGRDEDTAHALIHEYGHHLDRAWAVAGVGEPNGTPVWWAARQMDSLLRGGGVAFDYSLGWSRSIGEVFAEDYAWVYRPHSYRINWLAPPDDALRAALIAELGGTPGTPAADESAEPTFKPTEQPVVVVRRGTLGPRARQLVRFRLLGPGRHVTVTSSVAGSPRAGTRARVEIVCDGRPVATGTFTRGRPARTLDVRGLGPALCSARLVSTSKVAHAYTLRLRLEIPNPS